MTPCLREYPSDRQYIHMTNNHTIKKCPGVVVCQTQRIIDKSLSTCRLTLGSLVLVYNCSPVSLL